MRLAAFPGMLLLLAAQAATAQQQVRFTGETTADPTLIRDALQQLLRHAGATQSCTTLSAVESSVLPEAYDPGPQYRVGRSSVTYERWDATLCGRGRLSRRLLALARRRHDVPGQPPLPTAAAPPPPSPAH